MKLLGREPTLVISVLTSAVLLLGTFGFHFLTKDQAAIWILLINGIAAALNAYFVRPIQPAAFTYVVGILAALAAAYGLNVGAETIAAVNGLVIAFLAAIVRGQVAPQETALTSA